MIKAWVFLPTIALARGILTPFFSLRVMGKQNLPKGRGFIILPKHQRWEDIPLLGLSVSRPLYYVAKQELFTSKVTSWYLGALGGIPLDRQYPIKSKKSFRAIKDLLRAGQGIVVFPEGTYYPGKMGPLKPGMIKFLLKRAGVPFIPVGIRYNRKGLSTDVYIRFGKPLWPNRFQTEEEFIQELSRKIAFLSGLRSLGGSS